MRYLFLVENGDGWVQATIDGVPVDCEDPSHFSGRMPVIQASTFTRYKSWEEHVEETVSAFR